MKDFHGTGGFAKVCSRNAILEAGRVTKSKSISKLSIKIPLGIGQLGWTLFRTWPNIRRA